MLKKCFLNWCILSGQLFIIVLSVGLGEYRGEPVAFEKRIDHYSGSPLIHLSEINITSDYQESRIQVLANNSVSCEDLEGVGSFDTTCLLNSNLYINSDLYVLGTGNLEILPQVSIYCPIEGCIISFNLSGNVKVGQDATVVAGSVIFSALSLTLGHNSSINTTSLGGAPPSQTSGTPVGYDGAGGGHGGRGASCLKTNKTNNWGGDVYAWSSLSKPWSYGSKGGGTSREHKFGGSGGGRVYLDMKDLLYINGSIHADGGDGGSNGGGGSGGSIFIHAQKL